MLSKFLQNVIRVRDLEHEERIEESTVDALQDSDVEYSFFKSRSTTGQLKKKGGRPKGSKNKVKLLSCPARARGSAVANANRLAKKALELK